VPQQPEHRRFRVEGVQFDERLRRAPSGGRGALPEHVVLHDGLEVISAGGRRWSGGQQVAQFPEHDRPAGVGALLSAAEAETFWELLEKHFAHEAPPETTSPPRPADDCHPTPGKRIRVRT
jgi:hypothetical protein